MHITHYDLFAGIGGFSLALEEIFDDATIRHIFCEWESFPTAVLRQHWPSGEFYGNIAGLVSHTDTERQGRKGRNAEYQAEGHHDQPDLPRDYQERQGFTIVTGGFPCQPFSHAGRRKGTADDRYQWPNMFAVIRNTKPEWVIAENVRGLVTWNDGLVLETVCADLESEGYEVQPFIIPAVAVGAPHRRDRVWIIGRNSANAHSQRISHGSGEVQSTDGEVPERYDHAEPGDTGRQPAADTQDSNGRRDLRQLEEANGGLQRPQVTNQEEPRQSTDSNRQRVYPDWNRNWQEVAFATCDDELDDGLRGRLVQLPDGTTLSYSKWRQNALKAFGNGIVPQVAMEIMQAIKEAI